MINVFSPCVTFNKVNTYDWFKENIVNLEEFPDYDPSQPRYGHGENHGDERHAYRSDLSEQRAEMLRTPCSGFREEPLAEQDLELTEEQFEELVNEFR